MIMVEIVSTAPPTSGVNWNQLVNAMVTIASINMIMNSMQNIFTPQSSMGGLTKVFDETLPILIIVKLLEKLG